MSDDDGDPCNIDATVAVLLSDLPDDASSNDIKTRMGMIRLSQARIHGNATYAATILQHAFAESKQSQKVHELLGEKLSTLERRIAQISDDDDEDDNANKRSSSANQTAIGATVSSSDEDSDEEGESGGMKSNSVADEVVEQCLLNQISTVQEDQKLLREQEARLKDRLRTLESLVGKTLPDSPLLQEAISASREYSAPTQIVECVVCHNRSAERAIIPCGHLCLCDQCTQTLVASSSHLQYCPLCRGSLLSTLRIFTPK